MKTPSIEPDPSSVRLDLLDPTSDTKPPLLALLGPTGVGKSDLAIQLAQRIDGEIVSADSRLLYRGMDIGTAKPTVEDRKLIPHHLIDVAEPDQVWSLAMFQSTTRTVIDLIHSRNRIPLLVGGSGQYIFAIAEGWELPKVKPNQVMRSVLEKWANQISAEGLHRRLSVVDPDAAKNIEERNLRRTIRALEVIFSTGTRFSAQRQRKPSPYRSLMLGLTRPREELYARIDARVDGMINSGLIDEVNSLLERGYPSDLPTFSAIGYREIIAYLGGKTKLSEAIDNIKRNTRVYVRRQANWFKPNDPRIHWFNAGERTLEDMTRMITDWLSNDNIL